LRFPVRAETGTNKFGWPRSPSYLGISYSRIRCLRQAAGELGDEPVILVAVFQAMAEDHVRVLRRPSAPRTLSRFAEMRGEMPVLELVQHDFRPASLSRALALRRASSARSRKRSSRPR
jgi:hypothetical protein